jgi:Zn-dependent peptidase ImmA (M78 family)
MNKAAPRLQLAIRAAAQVLKDHHMHALAIDPFAIASACDILVEPKPQMHDGVSGMLIRVNTTFGILYATHIPSPGFQRFSVAHELGHYFIEGHAFQLLANGAHASRANFASPDPFEVEADMFAASLLMPRGPFVAEMAKHDDGIGLVIALAELCQTSLTSTAVSYARHTRSAVAVIQARDGIVEFCTVSDAMKTEPLGWLRRGDYVPDGSVTQSFARIGENVAGARTASGNTILSAWFRKAKGRSASEEVIGLGRFGRTLTILHCPGLSLAADGHHDEESEDEALLESWTLRFR